MNVSYGRLTLVNHDGPDQEFELVKSTISLGRANTNDIVLNEARISRRHACLEYSPQGVALVDLNSANGTRLNGERVERATLVPGDTISLGSQQLRYRVGDPSEDVGMTVIDTELQFEQAMEEEFLPVVLDETGHPSLVVHTGEGTWRVDLKDTDRATIGRDESCAVYIDADKVSRRHAELQRQGDAFLLKDLNSTNGTWMQGEKVDERRLQDGDLLSIGHVQLLFKAGFQDQALTMVEERLAIPSGRRTVVFLPGLMGSELWLGQERVWPNVKTMITNPDLFLYPSEHPLEPRGVVEEVVIVPNLIKQDQYNRLGDYMVDELRYRRGVDYFEFPYDWRQDVRISARQLGSLVESLPEDRPLVIIAHSLGTMVTRYYVENLGGDKRIERVILMGGPHRGAVKGLTSMLVAPEVLPFGIMGERMRDIMLSFPSSYQILPDYPVGVDQHGIEINFLQEDAWLDDKYRPLLQMGRDFRRELKSTAASPSVSIFGYGVKTISGVSIRRDKRGLLENVDYIRDKIGDGSVLEQSAVLPGSDIHPVHQHHGALFVDNDVKMRLKLELTRPFE